MAVIGATFLIRALEGRPISEPVFPVLVAAEAGGIAGLATGYYNAVARREATQASAVSVQLAETWIDSEPGEGTTVSFTLPALSEE